MSDTPSPTPRLTELAHGGGCGCKLSPAVLRELLAGGMPLPAFPNLLVGTETGDDAAVYQLDEDTCIIATTDFFMPMVDDPRDFGRIAATNAISDVYAMGGKPIMALAILGMPLGKLSTDVVAKILEGGREVAAHAGIPVAGGHSIDTPEPIYGLAVIGTARAEHIRRNASARPGDVLILTKPLGVGHYAAAFKKGALDGASYDEMVGSMTRLNAIGAALGQDEDVHAMTDVTGFGLLGHALEVARGSGLSVEIAAEAVPLLRRAGALAQNGHVTGASHRNWASYGEGVALPAEMAEWQRHVLTDPQTSGGLLLAVAPEAAPGVLAKVQAAGFAQAAIIGRAVSGAPQVRISGVFLS